VTTDPRHVYVVPAYGLSPHLDACLSSLRAQTLASRIVVSTSTPSDALAARAAAHGVELHVHGPNRGIGPDWNAALAAAGTALVTLAHQDDTYLPGHAAAVVGAFRTHPGAVLAFTDYRELHGDRLRPLNRTLVVKRIQREIGLLGRDVAASRRAKRAMLRFGNSIPCPAVTLDMAAAPDFRFREDMRTNMDWDAWSRLAEGQGPFLYVRDPLLLHRIHEGSETTACISSGLREREDCEMFEMFWPPAVARVLTRLYAGSYATNR